MHSCVSVICVAVGKCGAHFVYLYCWVAYNLHQCVTIDLLIHILSEQSTKSVNKLIHTGVR